MQEINTTIKAIAANFLANPVGSSITASESGVIVATENIVGSAGNTGVITSFVSQNTLSMVNETLNGVTLGVRHITGGADTLTGDAQNNWLAGGLGADSLSGGAANDVLIGGRGDDALDGGDGIDVAEFSGSYADDRITKVSDANGATIFRVVDTRTGQDGADTLTNIEKLSFSDVSRVDLSIDSPLPVQYSLAVNCYRKRNCLHTKKLVCRCKELSKRAKNFLSLMPDSIDCTGYTDRTKKIPRHEEKS
jgi:Ca2+-binding RTX toxin-like protein